MKRRRKLNRLNKPVNPVLSISVILGTGIVFILIVFIKTGVLHFPLYQNQMNTPAISPYPTNAPNLTGERFIPLTPTILPSSRQGWQTFVYPNPNKKYTFAYPSSWKLELLEDKLSPTFLGVSATQVDGTTNHDYGISFETGGRDFPDYDFKVVKHTYGGRNATEKILYNDNKLFEAFIWFDDYNPDKDPFVAIDIRYPTETIEGYQQTVDQILSSLTFYY